jgi:hypothetical protein
VRERLQGCRLIEGVLGEVVLVADVEDQLVRRLGCFGKDVTIRLTIAYRGCRRQDGVGALSSHQHGELSPDMLPVTKPGSDLYHYLPNTHRLPS